MNNLTKIIEQHKKLIVIIGILLIISSNSINQSSSTKKESFPVNYGTQAAAVGVAAATSPWWIGIPYIGWIIGGAGLLLLGPSIIDNWVNLFRPDPTIPSWIWIGAFLVILFLILKKKGGN